MLRALGFVLALLIFGGCVFLLALAGWASDDHFGDGGEP